MSGYKKLEIELEKIGYSIRGPNNINMWIHNYKGLQTCWRVIDNQIELRNCEVFGKEKRKHTQFGGVYINLDKCNIEKISDTCVSIGNNDLFISFYNFDKNN